jgi:PPP family 3-phenylpropionic acid transporter
MILAAPPSRHPDAPRLFKLRAALLFGAAMMVMAIQVPFFPVWLNTLHFSESEIGIILGVPLVLRVICAPLVAMLADRMRERAVVLIWSGILCLLTASALFFTERFWPVLLVFGLQGAVYAPYLPIVESIVATGVRRWGFDYGSIRVWGSVAFIACTLVIGWLISLWTGAVVLPAMLAIFIVSILAGVIAPRTGRSRAPTRAAAAAVRGKGSLLRRPHLQLLMIGASAAQASHGMYYGFSSIYWNSIGFSGTEVGLLWSGGVAAEVLVFFLALRIGRWMGPWPLIRIGCAVAVLRWALFPLSLGFGFYLALQCLHALTFAFTHMGIQRRIVEAVGEEQEVSAQGAYFFYNGAFLAASTFASGAIFKQFGVDGFYAMSGLAAFGLVLVLAAYALQPQSAVSGGNTSDPS